MSDRNGNLKRARAFRDDASPSAPVAKAPAFVEPLEQRQMCSGTVYSINIVGVAAPTQPLPQTALVAKPGPGFMDFSDWW